MDAIADSREAGTRSGPLGSLARYCIRRRKLVVAGWLLALLVFLAASQAVGVTYSTAFTLPDSPSTRARALFERAFPAGGGDTDRIVLAASAGTVTAAPVRARVQTMLGEVRRLPHVQAVTGPYGATGRRQISRDGSIAYATVVFDAPAHDLPATAVRAVIRAARQARGPALDVALAGQSIRNVEPRQSSDSAVLGIVAALIVLGLAFGAFFAALTPIVTAVVAIGIGYALTGLTSHLLPVADFAPILGVLLGLGVGIDYALFILTRHRAGLRAGRSVEAAAAAALATAGHAVLVAGLTVAIALLGQFALGLSFLDSVAVTATVTVALTMLASLTLLPALLGFLGVRALSRRERRRIAESVVEPAGPTRWCRWSRTIERHRRLPAAAAVVTLMVLAVPVFSLRLSLDSAGSGSPAATTRQAFDLMAKGFGPGVNGPFQLVAEVHGGQRAAFARVVGQVAALPGVASASQPRLNAAGTAAVALLYPSTGPATPQTATLLDQLRSQAIPAAEAGTGLHVLVGGATATQVDFAAALARRLPAFVAVVVIVGFLLLLLAFRSLLIPAAAAVLNVVSIAAALGVVNAVFGWHWGARILDVSVNTQVEVFLPVIMFAVLFGLSMDYEVFLVSRIHEEWQRTGKTQLAVTRGLAATGQVITAAATIMVAVFASFLLSGGIVVKQFGVGLAAAVVVDAFVVRTVLVPALMHLFGAANWWLPGWLDRILPRVHFAPSSNLDRTRQAL